MKRSVFYIFILFLFSARAFAQVNLVPNPSFELHTSCPTGSGQLSLAIPWQGVTTNSSDYFNVCGTGGATVPFSGSNFQNARTGNAYAAIWVINSYGGNYREYLQVKLDSTLIVDSCYLIEFYCNLVNVCSYGVDKIGAYISNTNVNIVGPGLVLQDIPQIISHGFLTDTLNWMHVAGYYHATGGEQYITIGNFNTDITTDTLNTGGTYNGAYYFIDDVSVTKLAGCDTVGVGIHEYENSMHFNLYPNPNNGNMIFEYTISATDHGNIQIMDYTGKLIANYVLDNASTKLLLNCTALDNGIYFYRVIINNRTAGYDKLIIIK